MNRLTDPVPDEISVFKTNSLSQIESGRKSKVVKKKKPNLFCDSILIDTNLVARYMEDVKDIFALEKLVLQNYREHKELKQFQILLQIDLKNRRDRKVLLESVH